MRQLTNEDGVQYRRNVADVNQCPSCYLPDKGARCVAPETASGSGVIEDFAVFFIINPAHVTTQNPKNSTRNMRPERRPNASIVGIVSSAPIGPITSKAVLSFRMILRLVRRSWVR